MYIACKKDVFGAKRLLSKKVIPRAQYIQDLYKSGK